jgi:murein DD-endopeptidase MepM/ murein hydrolase activator NlpD
MMPRGLAAPVVAALIWGAPAPVVAAARRPIRVSVSARTIVPGELALFSIALAAPADTVAIRVFNRDIPTFQEGPLLWRALVGIDLGVRPRAYRAAIEARAGRRRVRTSYVLHVLQHQFRIRELSVDEAFVTPPPEVEDRIGAEARQLGAIWNESAAERLWSGPFRVPVPDRPTSRFGTRSVFNGQPRNPHNGADFLSPEGRPIEAPNAGRVVLAGELYFSGNTIIIDHGLGLFSTLAHLSRIDVVDGDQVAAGAIVGLVGATGRVTGPHLHWAIRANGARVDPLSLLHVLGTE